MATKNRVARQTVRRESVARQQRDPRPRPGPAPRMEICDGCGVETAGSAIWNVQGDDGRWRALCPRCRHEGSR